MVFLYSSNVRSSYPQQCQIYKNDSIIEIYDNHNIFILPSFTEGHPQVLDEALSRLRPVIIFDDISHVVGNREGIFIAKRNAKSLTEVKISFPSKQIQLFPLIYL